MTLRSAKRRREQRPSSGTGPKFFELEVVEDRPPRAKPPRLRFEVSASDALAIDELSLSTLPDGRGSVTLVGDPAF